MSKAGKQAGRQQAGSSIRASARYYANGSACLPALGSARLGLARAPALTRTLPRYPSLRSSVGLSMPLRHPRRSSVTRLSWHGHLSFSPRPSAPAPLRRPATPTARPRRRAKPSGVEAAPRRHATSRAVRADARPMLSSVSAHARLPFSTLYPPPLSSTRTPCRDILPLVLPSPLLFLATALSVLSTGRLVFSVRLLVHRRRTLAVVGPSSFHARPRANLKP